MNPVYPSRRRFSLVTRLMGRFLFAEMPDGSKCAAATIAALRALLSVVARTCTSVLA